MMKLQRMRLQAMGDAQRRDPAEQARLRKAYKSQTAKYGPSRVDDLAVQPDEEGYSGPLKRAPYDRT